MKCMATSQQSNELVFQNSFLANHAHLISSSKLKLRLNCACCRISTFFFSLWGFNFLWSYLCVSQFLFDQLVQLNFPADIVEFYRLYMLAKTLGRVCVATVNQNILVFLQHHVKIAKFKISQFLFGTSALNFFPHFLPHFFSGLFFIRGDRVYP